MTRYHQAAYTLDPNQEIPEGDEVAPAAGHNEEDAAFVKELADEHKAAYEAEVQAANEQAAEWDERDPKPLPSELLQERGYEPAPAENGSTSTTGSDVPDGTVQEVLDWAGEDPDRIQSALNAERAGQNRSSLITELEKRQAAA